MRNWTKTAVTGGLAALLVACGGGGGGSSAPGAFSGKVIDGYIVGATVCLDLNSNTKCDAGEPSATTTAGGAYSFTYSGSVAGLHVIAEVPVGAIDEDLGAVTDAYSLFAPASAPSAVTPLTTLVSSEMMASGSSASEAESAVKTSLGISVDLLANNFKASGDTTVQDTAQKIVAAIAEAKKTLDNDSTVASEGLTPGQIIKQAVNQVKNDVLPGLISSDGSITKSVADIKTDASTNITGNLQNIVAKTKTGSGTVLSMKDAFSAGMVVVQKDSGNYLVGENTITPFSDLPVVEYMKMSFEGDAPTFAGTTQKVLLDSGWTDTIDTARHWLLVDGVWSRRVSQGAMTVADNCVKVQRTLIGIQDKYCLVRRDVTGKTLGSILPKLCENIVGCSATAELPAGSYVYDLTASAVDDQYDFYISETWGGYLTADYTETYNQDQTMTLAAFIAYTSDEQHRQFEGHACNTAFWFTEYDDSTKTGKVNWKRNESETGCDNPTLAGDTETTNFTVKTIGGVDIMVAETSRLYRTGTGNNPRQLLKAFAYVPADIADGRPLGGIRSGDVKLKKYSQRVEFNGDFRSSSQIMSKPVYKAIETALTLPAFPFSDETMSPSMLRRRR
ncbi:MAG: hypothetical protein EBR49_17410 [Betaproteobacteria bacterium]|nr:hypothetical protein [Betaproteobacteria bacterium]